MSIFRRRRETLERLDEVERLVNEVANTAAAREPQVNRLSDFLSKRNNVNGFGQDFELTLIPRGGK